MRRRGFVEVYGTELGAEGRRGSQRVELPAQHLPEVHSSDLRGACLQSQVTAPMQTPQEVCPPGPWVLP